MTPIFNLCYGQCHVLESIVTFRLISYDLQEFIDIKNEIFVDFSSELFISLVL